MQGSYIRHHEYYSDLAEDYLQDPLGLLRWLSCKTHEFRDLSTEGQLQNTTGHAALIRMHMDCSLLSYSVYLRFYAGVCSARALEEVERDMQ